MQEEIIKLLIKMKRPLSRVEIAVMLKARPEKISNRLTPMIRSKEISCVEIDKDTALIKYGSKRRLRLYYVEGFLG